MKKLKENGDLLIENNIDYDSLYFVGIYHIKIN